MKRSSEGGFTIVETMIVLGVTALLFTSLVTVVRGQQGKAQFRSAVTDITTQIQSLISEVSTGYYPKNQAFTCSAVGGNVTLTNTTASQLGANKDCTYLGQAIMFDIPSTDPEQYKIHTLIGARQTLSGDVPKSLREADTQVLSKGLVNNNISSWPNYVTTKTLQFGSDIVWMRSRIANQPIAGFAVVASPNQELTFSNDNMLESGNIVPVIMPIINPSASSGGYNAGASEGRGVDLIISSLGQVAPLPAENYIGPIDICMASGSTNQSALIMIGSNSSTTSVDFIVKNTRDCT